jgi:hypothetical protein
MMGGEKTLVKTANQLIDLCEALSRHVSVRRRHRWTVSSDGCLQSMPFDAMRSLQKANKIPKSRITTKV